MKSNRKGIALLWVMLVSALIFVAILGISMRVVPQKKIENSREYAQRALAVAESGMAAITYDLRTDTPAPAPPPASRTVVLKSYLQSLSVVGDSYDSTPVNYDSGAVASGHDSTYQVRIKKTSTGYTFYSLGTVGLTSTPLARQAITVQYSGNFPISDYGVLSQTSIHMQGGSIKGNVYANDVIMGNKNDNGVAPTFVQPFAAYAPVQGGSITGVPAGEYAYVSAISVPKLTTRFPTYRAYWNDFLAGSGVYDGSSAHVAAGYPNTSSTSNPDVHTWITTTLGVTSGPAYQSAKVGNTTFGFDVFFSAIQEAVNSGVTSTPAGYLGTLLSNGTMVYDIQPSASNKPVDLGSSYASAPFLEGTVLIEGDLQLDGGAQIGVNPSKTAILVAGSVNVSGGQSTLNGLLYIDSFDSNALSIKATGGLSVTGSIVAQGGIDLGSNGLSVVYNRNDIYDAEIKGNLSQSGLNPVPSSWRQISYDAFSLMQ